MNPNTATEIAYKNGYAAGRADAFKTVSIYTLSEDEHITRCAKCKSQLLFNHLHVKHETYYNHIGEETLDVIYCPKCNSRIILPTGIV
jgi:DNA-directed RNA polymerase subunit RPC12/RpoP